MRSSLVLAGKPSIRPGRYRTLVRGLDDRRRGAGPASDDPEEVAASYDGAEGEAFPAGEDDDHDLDIDDHDPDPCDEG